MEIFLKKNSSKTFVNFFDGAEKKNVFLRFILAENAVLHLWNFHFGTDAQTHSNEIIFEGKNAETYEHTIFFGTGNGVMNLSTKHIHKAKNGISKITARGVLKDKAYAKYDGLIRIEKNAVKTSASLEEKILLLNSGANADAIPRLEIETNDVKAGHSAAITRIDENQLFYAASRGLSEKEAIKLIVSGFLKNPVRNIIGLTNRYLCR